MLALALAAILAQEPEEAPAAVSEAPLSARVNRAIAKGVEFVRGRQAPDGGWSGFEGEHPGGLTALATLTLVKSGVRRSDESVRKGLAKVLATEFKSTYSHSVRLMLLDGLGQPETYRQHAEVGLDFLVANQVGGEWAYPWGGADASNSQFALLGLRAAHRQGLEVPDVTLLNAAKALFRLQADNGGFKYEVNRQPTGGMTAATLGGLCVLRELGDGRSAVEGFLRKNAKQLELAEEWMVERWSPSENPYGSNAWTPGFHYPYLWAVERWCGLSNRSKLAGHDWYEEGARWLVDQQMDNGSWTDTVENTCFALLFLRRATISQGGALGETDAELDALRPPRPVEPQGDVPRIGDWLIAGPWRGEGPNDALHKLPFDPAKLAPREGGKLLKREWRRFKLKPDGWENLDELLALECDDGFAVAATYLSWPLDRPLEASLWLDVEDGYKVYLDGALIGQSRRVQGPADGRVLVPLTLTRGEHLLVCLIEDELGAACFGARLTGTDGKALPAQPAASAAGAKGKAR